MILTGNKARLQVGLEDAFGTLDTTTVEYAFLQESLKENREKKTEGVIVGCKGEPASVTTKIAVEGNISVLARPDDIGILLGAALGEEANVTTVGTAGKKHTFTAIETTESNSLPSLTILVDRIADIFGYSGCKIDELKLSSAAGDFVKVEVTLMGQAETGSQSLASLSRSALKPFLFSGGSLAFGCTEVEITSVDFSLKNSLDNSLQTNTTGLYPYEPQPAERQISISAELLFDDTSLAQYTAYYKTDTPFTLELSFTSEEEIETGLNYSLDIIIPAVQITGSDFNISGKDVLKHKFDLKAIDTITLELITVVLINKTSGKYI